MLWKGPSETEKLYITFYSHNGFGTLPPSTQVDSSLCSSRQSASEEQASNEKENTLPSCTPVVSKVPHKKRHLGGTKRSSVKKQPLAILNKH